MRSDDDVVNFVLFLLELTFIREIFFLHYLLNVVINYLMLGYILHNNAMCLYWGFIIIFFFQLTLVFVVFCSFVVYR